MLISHSPPLPLSTEQAQMTQSPNLSQPSQSQPSQSQPSQSQPSQSQPSQSQPSQSQPSQSQPSQSQPSQSQPSQSQPSLSQSSMATQVSNAPLLASDKSLNSTQLTLQQDTVTLSPQAIELAKQSSDDLQTLPVGPTLPNDGDKIEVYVEYKKAKMQYQIYSDIANIATGSNNGTSPATAYYLSNNDEARAATVNAKALQQQVASMQTYVDTTKSLNQAS
ncbi:hypothetical protein ACVBIL_15050 [Shewanella sp. 125m-7]